MKHEFQETLCHFKSHVVWTQLVKETSRDRVRAYVTFSDIKKNIESGKTLEEAFQVAKSKIEKQGRTIPQIFREDLFSEGRQLLYALDRFLGISGKQENASDKGSLFERQGTASDARDLPSEKTRVFVRKGQETKRHGEEISQSVPLGEERSASVKLDWDIGSNKLAKGSNRPKVYIPKYRTSYSRQRSYSFSTWTPYQSSSSVTLPLWRRFCKLGARLIFASILLLVCLVSIYIFWQIFVRLIDFM